MSLTYQSGLYVEDNFQVEGVITDGLRQIVIKPIHKWSNGKSTPMNYIIGYEFYMDDKCQAALQPPKSGSYKNTFVWLRDNLSEELKPILAAADIALLELLQKRDSMDID
ncbi:hypothetical protein [Mangrovibacterium lignilyticum]|uniref:hypothetical protein n=1 Tax=Mangrovibacterium lignilyticum TaxID=2668052 RepID=UPI0013D35C7A|nr:hypothetical protein [Mangrovibacterium lignilyticum]